MNEELVDELRAYTSSDPNGSIAVMREAADEIDRLRKLVLEQNVQLTRHAAAVKVLDALDCLTDPEGSIQGLAPGPEKDELESALAAARMVP